MKIAARLRFSQGRAKNAMRRFDFRCAFSQTALEQSEQFRWSLKKRAHAVIAIAVVADRVTHPFAGAPPWTP